MMKILYRQLNLLILGTILIISHGINQAKPIVPDNDQQILEVLPTSRVKNLTSINIYNARKTWQSEPSNLENAVTLARLYVTESRLTSDIRYLGYAEAVIAPWKFKNPVPIPIMLISATVAQRNHLFDAALKEITEVLKGQPDHAEALLLQASIYQVKGEYDAAKGSCRKLYNLSTLTLGMICSAQIDGLTGHIDLAFQQISKILNLNDPGLTTGVRQWLLRIYIDLAQRLGKEKIIDDSFKLIMKDNPTSEIKAAYADWLLSKGRFNEVIQLSHSEIKDDGMLLRLIIAEMASNKSDVKSHISLLQDRFAAARLRNERVHLREEARFMLEVLNKKDEALELAAANWNRQKEPVDAALLLDAAIATKRISKATPVLNWIKKWHIQDPSLEQRTKYISRLSLQKTPT